MGAYEQLSDRLDCLEADVVFLLQELSKMRKACDMPDLEHWRRDEELKKNMSIMKGTTSCYQEKRPKRARPYAI